MGNDGPDRLIRASAMRNLSALTVLSPRSTRVISALYCSNLATILE